MWALILLTWPVPVSFPPTRSKRGKRRGNCSGCKTTQTLILPYITFQTFKILEMVTLTLKLLHQDLLQDFKVFDYLEALCIKGVKMNDLRTNLYFWVLFYWIGLRKTRAFLTIFSISHHVFAYIWVCCNKKKNTIINKLQDNYGS